MKKCCVVVRNRAGLHARPASLITQVASCCQSEVSLSYADRENDIMETANAKSVISIIALGVPYLAELELVVEGADEEKVFEQIKMLFDNKFEEAD